MKKEIKGWLWILAALFAIRLLSMAFVPLFDPSEARYAAISSNMAATGDFLVPRFTHKGVYQSFDGKPPLLFQAGGRFCQLLGRSKIAVRLPSFLAALTILGLVYFVTYRQAGPRRAFTATGICATSCAFYAMSGICMTDMLLTLAVAGAILLYAEFDRNPNPRTSIGIFLLLAVGMLSKGPVALVLFGLPVLVYTAVNRRWGTLRQHAWIFGGTLFLAIAAPWFILMAKKDPSFLEYFFINENLLRFLVHDYGDRYGAGRETFRGMAIIWFVVVNLPWGLLGWRLFRERKGLHFRGVGATSLLFTGWFCITLFWCLTSRVPLLYLLPTVPIFSVWMALQIPPIRLLRRLPLFAGLCTISLLGVFGVTMLITDKMPETFYRAVLATLPKNATISYVGRAPYSAEFHLRGKIAKPHEKADFLIYREKRLKKTNIPQQAILLRKAGWILVDPDKKGVQK